jgi:predicted NAD/FAD-dependent oxidoreductase
LAGLTAARSLRAASFPVIVLEAGAGAGGRLATLIDAAAGAPAAVFDHGAQFFTVRDPAFAGVVETWLSAGLVIEWSRGFATADGSYYADGYPRYRAAEGMASLAAGLATDLEILFNQHVAAISAEGGLWRVTTAEGESWTAQRLILTPPVPQSLALLAAGSVILDQDALGALAKIDYEPCIAVMLQLNRPSNLPEPGGMWPLGEPLAWMADNHRKGISAAPGAVTLHAGPEFSQSYWQAPDEQVVDLLVEAAGEWLGAEVVRSFVRRWRYSKPWWTHPQSTLFCAEPAPLIFAGDAFAGPRVEGAVLSGMAAGRRLLK